MKDLGAIPARRVAPGGDMDEVRLPAGGYERRGELLAEAADWPMLLEHGHALAPSEARELGGQRGHRQRGARPHGRTLSLRRRCEG